MIWKLTKEENSNFKCYNCKSNNIEYEVDESSCGGFEDYHYHCKDCNKFWWVESSDS